MKKWIIALFITALATPALASSLETDGDKRQIQGAAPNGLYSQTLTAASTTVSMVDRLWWSVYSATACKYRLMPTTSKGSYPQFTVPADTPIGMVVNKSAMYVNYSGCTSGELSIQ